MVNVSNAASYGKLNIEPKVRQKDIKTLVKYVNGESLNVKPDTFLSAAKDGATSAVLFEGIPLALMMKRNKAVGGKFYSDGLRDLQNKVNVAKKSGNLKTFAGKIGEFQSEYEKLKASVKAEYKANHGLMSKIKKLFGGLSKETAEQTTKKAVEETVGKTAEKVVEKTAEKVVEKTAENVAENAVKKTGGNILKNAFKKVFPKTSEKVAGKFAKTAGTKVTKGLGKVGGKLKGTMKTSGAGAMIAYAGISEVITEVIPTFKELGAKKGVKQVGKSAVKVTANAAGYVAGAKLGSTIGTAICPGIGTAVGAAVGFIGGMIGSFVAGKIADSVVGKNEREIANEQKEKSSVRQISKDNDKIKELQLAALQRIQEEAAMNGGELSEDSKLVLEAIENIGEIVPLTEKDLATNPFEEEQV